MKASQGKDLNGGVYGTPLDFLIRTHDEFGIGFDLAADPETCVVKRLFSLQTNACHFNVEQDSLRQEWHKIETTRTYWLWCNPPFSDIAPWAKKCAEESGKGARILLLVPQGSQKWNMDHCQGKSLELRLVGRLTFEGQTTPYPKDLSLFVFGAGMTGCGFWDWRRG